MRREATHLRTITDLRGQIKALQAEMLELKESMRQVMRGERVSIYDDHESTSSTAEGGSAAIHHLYQDLFITDLKKEMNQ